jgi:hypothetical protein
MPAETPPPIQEARPTIQGPAKLYCYAINEHPPKLVPAAAHRDWMDAYHDRHAYRCLPLNIANAHGWFVLSPSAFEVEWNGGARVEDLVVRPLEEFPDKRPFEHFARTNFGHGIVTLHTDYIFRTEPGWDLLASGPYNMPKENCYALTGIIEADWLPYPFTMNWKLVKPGTVRFEAGEPFCFVYPIPKQALLETQPEIHRLADEPELLRQHEAFRVARDEFMKRVRAGEPAAIKQAWQRYYFTGRHPDGAKVDGHVNRMRLREAVDVRRPLQAPAVSGPTSAPQGRWEQGGPLDWIDHRQTVLNQAGRSRIAQGDGTFTPSPHTRWIRTAQEAEGDDFLMIESLFSDEECAAVCAAFDQLKDRHLDKTPTDPYWRDRFVWLTDFLRETPSVGRMMMDKAAAARDAVARFYRLRVPIYNDLLQIVQWPVGHFMAPHADALEPDGRVHSMAHRAFGGVAYLNDDYGGGELYFTALDIAVKPRRGMFVAFTSGFHHEHGVTVVQSGQTRLTMPTFYTFDAQRADRSLHPAAA